MKRICSNEVQLSSRLEDLEHWFCNRDYKKQMIHNKMRKVHMTKENLLRNREKQHKNDRLTLVLTYHPAS